MAFLVNIHGQNNNKKILVSIYEYGDSIVNCETNFKNLFSNWTVKNIINAPDYKLQNYAFVDAISDSIILNDYCRYFTSNRMLGASIKQTFHSNVNGTEERKFAIQPNQFNLDTLFATKDKRVKKLFEDLDFTQEVMRMNSDEYHVNDSTNGRISNHNATDSLSDSEFKIFLLESTRKERLMKDRSFKELVKIGDLVYVIHFRYNGKLYSDYVICDPDSKRVILDSFFARIKIWV